MKDIYKNIEEYNVGKEHMILTVYDDMIADMLTNKKLNPIVTELFIRGAKLNISLVIITQSCFAEPKCQTKFYKLFYYENSKHTRASTNRI